MAITDDLDPLNPPGGWPAWVSTAPYLAAAHPQVQQPRPVDEGANCQRYAYAVLELFGRVLPPHRSSGLWLDADFEHRHQEEASDLDLALFNDTPQAWGAHVALIVGQRLLHLCAEEGRPALWTWADFAERARYAHLLGVVRTVRQQETP